MPWRGPNYPGEFPTLGYQVAALIQEKCVIPDGDHAGEPLILTDEMIKFLLWFYRVDPETEKFYYYRGGQLTRPQKWGKGPFASAIVCAEVHPDGPVLFDGWDGNGEPVGRPWATPWVQITAVSEDQTDNVWRSLIPMIEMGDLKADIPDTGKTRINLPGGGFIEPVTASARSRLGQRITFSIQDETHNWVNRNGGRDLADNQRRNLSGMGGRWLSTTNAWDINEDSVAQYTAEKEKLGVYNDDVDPGTGSIRNKQQRRKMLRKVYGGSYWVDLDRIDAEIEALLERDPAQAERYFLNRKVAGEDKAIPSVDWQACEDKKHVVAKGTKIAIGVDGARFADALAVIATEVETGYQWPLGIWERPESASDDYEHPDDEVDGAMVEAMNLYKVLRVYVDPQWIDHLLVRWQGRYGNKKVLPWYTNRPRQMTYSVRNYVNAVRAHDVSHGGDKTLTQHVLNAVKKKVNVYDDQHRKLWSVSKDRHDSPRKIDALVAAILSWEAKNDAVASGADKIKKRSGRMILVP